MRPVLAIAVAAALAGTGVFAQTAPAPAAQPTDLIETLNTVCVAAQADAARVAELAVAAGYSPVPEAMLPRFRGVSGATGFMKSSAADMVFVVTGTMSQRVARRRIVMPFCGVSARPADHRALERRLREAMGFDPVVGLGMSAYAWLQTSQGRAPTRNLDDPTVVAMAETGQMRMVGLDRSRQASILLYFLPRAD